MPSPPLHRFVLAILPALLLVGIGASAVWGETGLLVRSDLRERLDSANADLAALERENQRLIRELSLLERDPIVLERQIAEDLGWAKEGTTLYRFEPGTANAPVDSDPARRPPGPSSVGPVLRPTPSGGATDRPLDGAGAAEPGPSSAPTDRPPGSVGARDRR